MFISAFSVYRDSRYVPRKTYRICVQQQYCWTKIQKVRNEIMMNNSKEVQAKLMKGLLDLIILQFLNGQPMHGYQIITKIRKTFGVYFGPSTIYPLLGTLEKKKFVKSEWNMTTERPRKVYKLTTEGQNLLNFTEDSLNFICKKIGTPGVSKNGSIEDNISQAALRPFLRKIEESKPLM
jgi:PadR family transcriptional regulator PadR